MDMMTPAAFAHINDVGARFRAGINEVFALTNVQGRARGHHSLFAIDIDDVDLMASHVDSAAACDGLARYLLNHGYAMAPGLGGAVSTIMEASDVAPFCETLLAGIRSIKGEA